MTDLRIDGYFKKEITCPHCRQDVTAQLAGNLDRCANQHIVVGVTCPKCLHGFYVKAVAGWLSEDGKAWSPYLDPAKKELPQARYVCAEIAFKDESEDYDEVGYCPYCDCRIEEESIGNIDDTDTLICSGCGRNLLLCVERTVHIEVYAEAEESVEMNAQNAAMDIKPDPNQLTILDEAAEVTGGAE